MVKFLIIVGVIYILYYVGNIFYDLFLKKEVIKNMDETEVFSVGDFAEETKEKVKGVGIEDVENINTPKSFSKKEIIHVEDNKTDGNSPDIEDLRKKFEAEENIDFFNATEIEEIEVQPEKRTNYKPEKIQNFFDLLNQAETNVQVVSVQDGRKVYQSTMI